MYGAQTGYPQGQWQQGSNHGRNYSGPPPPKKVKGNPIITRYAPPPGYRGPAAPPAPYQTQAWQQPPQPYRFGQPSHPSYPPASYGQPASAQLQPPQHYGASQTYAQPQYPAYPHSNYTQPGAQAPYPVTVTAPQWYPPVSYPQSAPPHQWPSQPDAVHQRQHSSAPYPIPHDTKPESIAGNDDSTPVYDQDFLDKDFKDLEEDFEGERYFASHPDEIVPELSLGFLTWHAPLPTKRPLEATYGLAEVEAIAVRKALPTDDESISDYFIVAKRHEALLSVRQTEAWVEVKNSLIFKEFALLCDQHLPMSELLERYRDRRDTEWMQREASATPEPDFDQQDFAQATYGAADSNSQYRLQRAQSNAVSEHSDSFSNFEPGLPSNGTAKPGRHSRTTSAASTSGQNINRPRPLLPIKDPQQEDILASLGVTGSPKIVYETPGPAIGPPAPGRDRSRSRHSRQNSVSSTPNGRHVPPPPPPPPMNGGHKRQRSSFDDPWRTGGRQYSNGRRGSASSQHTATGSDFNEEDREQTPRAAPSNSAESRKRAHEDGEDGDLSIIHEQDEDATPRAQKQRRVEDAFSRRW